MESQDPGREQYLNEVVELLKKQVSSLHKLKVPEENGYELAEQSYETLNNLARCMSQMGDMAASLKYLKKAETFVERMGKYYLQTGHGIVFVASEYFLNLSNACLCQNELQQAKINAERAVKESRLCMN